MTGCDHILLADGNPDDADVMEEVIIDAAFAGDVHRVVDHLQTNDFLRREGVFADAPRPDLVLLDLALPENGGGEIVRAMRADPELQRIPVIICLPSDSESVLVRNFGEPTGFLMKPRAFYEYLEVVKTIVQFWERVREP